MRGAWSLAQPRQPGACHNWRFVPRPRWLWYIRILMYLAILAFSATNLVQHTVLSRAQSLCWNSPPTWWAIGVSALALGRTPIREFASEASILETIVAPSKDNDVAILLFHNQVRPTIVFVDTELRFLGNIVRDAGSMNRQSWLGWTGHPAPQIRSVGDTNSDGELEVMVIDYIASNDVVTSHRVTFLSLETESNRVLWACSYDLDTGDGQLRAELSDVNEDNVPELVLRKYSTSNRGTSEVVAIYQWRPNIQRYETLMEPTVNGVLVWNTGDDVEGRFGCYLSLDKVLRRVGLGRE